MSSTRAALEAAVAANPDDVVAHSAYSDLLTEEGDPRGEFINLQLALEDSAVDAGRRRAIIARVAELREQHDYEWLGSLGPYVHPRRRGVRAPGNVAVTFRRGWLHRVEVGRLTDDVCGALADAPFARLLAELTIRTNVRSEPGRRQDQAGPTYVELESLAESPNIRNLRRIELGAEDVWQFTAFDSDVGELVRRTPRLEHLVVAARRFVPDRVFAAELSQLHSLRVTTNNSRLPIAVLGNNPSLENLATLHLDLAQFMPDPDDPESERQPIYLDELNDLFGSPHLTALRHLTLRLPGFGDAGVEELARSGLLGRLRGLDLSRSDITDEGAEILAGQLAVPGLEYLRLDYNYLSPIGIDALASVGVHVSERQFFVRGEWSDEDELMEDSDLV